MKIIFLIVLQIFTVGAIQIRAQDVPPIQCSYYNVLQPGQQNFDANSDDLSDGEKEILLLTFKCSENPGASNNHPTVDMCSQKPPYITSWSCFVASNVQKEIRKPLTEWVPRVKKWVSRVKGMTDDFFAQDIIQHCGDQCGYINLVSTQEGTPSALESIENKWTDIGELVKANKEIPIVPLPYGDTNPCEIVYFFV